MEIKIEFKDKGQDFLFWVIDTQKEEIVDCGPSQQSIWIGMKVVQKTFVLEEYAQFILDGKTHTCKYPIESVEFLDEEFLKLIRQNYGDEHKALISTFDQLQELKKKMEFFEEAVEKIAIQDEKLLVERENILSMEEALRFGFNKAHEQILCLLL